MSGMCTSAGVLVFQGSLKCAITVLNLPFGGTAGSRSNKPPTSKIQWKMRHKLLTPKKCIANTPQHNEFIVLL